MYLLYLHKFVCVYIYAERERETAALLRLVISRKK
jgi:hypothetical protein